MTRALIDGIGFEMAEGRAYDTNQLPTGFSLVTSPAPAQGTYLLKATGTTGGNLDHERTQNVYNQQFRWLCLREFRLDGTLNAGQVVSFLRDDTGGDLEFKWVYATGSTYQLRLTIGGATNYTTTTTYATGSPISIRLENRTIFHYKVWINGVLEFNISTGANSNLRPVFRNTTLAAGQDMYWGAVGCWDAFAEFDRPGTTIDRYSIHPNGDSTGEYGGLISGGSVDCAATA